MSTSELPSVPEPAVQRGARLLADGRAEDAVGVLREVVAEAPIYAAAHVLLAAALDAAGRPEEALDVWHRAAFLVPSSPLVQRECRRLGGAPEAPSPPAPEMPYAEPASPDGEAPSSGSPTPEEPAAEPEPTAPEPTAPATPEAATVRAAPEPKATPDRELPEGAHLAPAEEMFTHAPPADRTPATGHAAPPHAAPPQAAPSPAAAAPFTESTEPAAAPDPPRAAAPPPPVPDWGDLGDPAVTVLPPEDAEPTPEPEEDLGGWAVLGETPRATPPVGPVRPAVVPPEGWTPPAAARTTTVSGAPTAPPSRPPASAAAPTPYPPHPYPAADPDRAAPPPDSFDADQPAAEPALADDLDALIESLETAPRITPDPEFDAPLPDLDGNVDDLASETLAKIYAAQHQYVEAAVVYERLAARTPEQAEALLARAAEMRRSAGAA